jgi:hypothetical protein
MITPIRSRYRSVVEIAKNLGFDMHRVPAKCYVLFNWYMGNDCVAMFDDNPMGDDEAIAWMQKQKGVVSVVSVE